MLQVPDEVWSVLGGSGAPTETGAMAQYQGSSVALNVDSSGGLTWAADGTIQCNGSVRVFGFGGSLVPKSRDALLSPTGQEISVSRTVSLRDAEFSIPLGVFRITGNDGGNESYRWDRASVLVDAPYVLSGDEFPESDIFPADDVFPGETSGGPFRYMADPQRTDTVLGWDVGVDLADRFRVLERAKIINPASPPPGATVYSELQRIALIPIVRATDVEDVVVPAGTVYDDRRSAVTLLAELAGAKARLTRTGALTLRPADRWAFETVPEFDLDGVVELSMAQTDEFYNYVWAHSPNGEFSSFLAFEDDSDPRSVNRAGMSTYEHSSPSYTSGEAAVAGARTILSRLLNRRSRTATVRVDARGLLVDLSDFGRVTDPATGRTVLGEVSGIRISHDPTALVELTLIVAEVS